MPFTAIDEAIAELPDSSKYRAVLRGLWSEDPAWRKAGEDVLRTLSKPYWEPPNVVPEAEAMTVLRAVLEVPAPSPAKFRRGVDGVVFSLIGSATPALLDRIREGYEGANEDTRLALLTVVASAATKDAARLFAELVLRFGWTPTHQRLLMELGKNVAHADVLFPAVVEAKGAPIVQLTDLMIAALKDKHLDPSRLAGTALATHLGPRITQLLETNAPAKHGELAACLDLAGYLGGAEMVPRLRKALEAPASWPRAFAILSLLRRGETIADEAFAGVASDPATRGIFYQLLKEIDAEARIPAAYRSRDAFAEADMVQWLSHPGELGEAPRAIEKMALFEAKNGDEDVVLYVWRFKGGDSDVWRASVSGPYPAKAPEGPLSGQSTFSRFDAWEKATAEQHASAVLKTLSEWAAKR